MSEIRAFLRIAENMGILEKDPNKVKVEIEISEYEENFDSELTWKNEVDLKEDNVFNKYNPAEALAAEAEEPKLSYKEQSIHKVLADYADIIYIDMKELAKTNIIQYTIYLLNLILIT